MSTKRIQSVTFSTFTAEEIRQLSTKRLTNADTFDQLLHPSIGGLYDPALGPTDKDDKCATCGLSSVHCPGHFGHIELPLPIYNPTFFRLMLLVLRGSCLQCHQFICKPSRAHLFIKQTELLHNGYMTKSAELQEEYFSLLADSEENDADDSIEEDLIAQIDEICAQSTDTEAKSVSTKNINKCKQDLNDDFMKRYLLDKCTRWKQCPHCSAPIQTVRSEFNSRIYLKPVGQKAAKNAAQKTAALKVEKKLQKSKDAIVKNEQKARVEEDEGYEEDDDVADEGGGLLEDVENLEQDNVAPENVAEQKLDTTKKNLSEQTYITPQEVKEHLVCLWDNDNALVAGLFGSFSSRLSQRVSTPQMFFLDTVVVPPSRFRPLSFLGDQRFENPQTMNLNKVLWDCKLVDELLVRVKEAKGDEAILVDAIPVVLHSAVKGGQRKGGGVSVPGKTYMEQLQNAWLKLQTDVNGTMDSSLNKLERDAIGGVRQLLERKDGLFRKHMMGKRVNFACRSVISPDPNISAGEIGVPLAFARKLTYPEPVTAYNISMLSKMVENGPNIYPGAVAIENEDGVLLRLNPNDSKSRMAQAKRLLCPRVTGDRPTVMGEKKVHRNLVNGDVLLLNRQPTLHRPSIMAHKAKVLRGERTLRLHYACCKSYNADFDGDEMNAHFPQSELGRAESYGLVATDKNYLSPKDGTPLAGLIQDHVVAGATLTTRDKFFTREDYQQLVFSALIDHPTRIKTFPPCIRKPVPLWSGKQVFSTILLNVIPSGKTSLNMQGKPKVSDKNWPKTDSLCQNSYIKDPFLLEEYVIIRGGELLAGMPDKSQYGSSAYGMIHLAYELYGGATAVQLLSVLARLFTFYLQSRGFTLGIEDILVMAHADEKRQSIIDESIQCGNAAAMEALNLQNCSREELRSRLQEAHHSNDGAELKQLDLACKSRTDTFDNKINSACMKGLVKRFPDNHLQLMVQSGAKGSSVNCMQISCIVGQIELEGRRPQLSMAGRFLPSFGAYDTSLRAGGFIDSRFLTGIRPQEYFFNCMAGREGLVDTAVKTSRSGYLQRCLIKHLEALYVQYDLTVRDGDGSIVQFLYGDDGVDVLRSPYLMHNQFKTLLQNKEGCVPTDDEKKYAYKIDKGTAELQQQKILQWKEQKGSPYSSYDNHTVQSPFHKFVAKYGDQIIADQDDEKSKKAKLVNTWRAADHKRLKRFKKKCMPCPDPVLSVYNPALYLGSMSEVFNGHINNYLIDNPDGLLRNEDEPMEGSADKKKTSHEDFVAMMQLKSIQSLVEPGEAVGLLAAQSIGEPSTQMTLNTFHFAGRGEVNVTLGIPRLREILMTASKNIKTPTMDVLVQFGEQERARELARRLNRLCLMQVLSKITVHGSLQSSRLDKLRCREYKVRLEFLPTESYEDDTDVTAANVMHFVEQTFLKEIISRVIKLIRLKQKQSLLNTKADDNIVNRRTHHVEEADVGERSQPDEPDDAADLSDEDLAGDGDADDLKSRNRKMQLSSYDNENDENIDNLAEESQTIDNDEALGEELETEEELLDNVKHEAILPDPNDRIQAVLRRDRHIVHYLVDEENLWCEATLQFPLSGSKVMLVSVIEKAAEKAVVRESPGIVRAMLSECKDPSELGRYRFRTEGVNIPEMRKYPHLFDLNSLYTNNIHSMADMYGIEAARCVLIKEITDVFKVYGIAISPRHLSLVADYMTYEGSYKPFNRAGIASNPSPLQKMTFETSMHFLRSATAFGEPDDLGSPSSRLIVGRPIRAGTGMVDLIPDLLMTKKKGTSD